MSTSSEVLTPQLAREEALRCLQCYDAPCVQACPAHIDIPRFISMISSGNIRGAAEVVRAANAMANVCGAVCPQEMYCQPACNHEKVGDPIRIRELHFYASQTEARTGVRDMRSFAPTGKHVVVAGSGPAGLACAFELVKFGHSVTIVDRRLPGGVPANSIPGFRLPQAVLQDDMHFLLPHLGFHRETIADGWLEKAQRHYDAVFIGIGLGVDRTPGIPGEDKRGVRPVLPFLEEARSGQGEDLTGKRVAVIGGGNVSLDAAATAKVLGARHVALLYRRSEREMRVWKSELDEARRRGVDIRCLSLPVSIQGDVAVRSMRCIQMTLTEDVDESGRHISVPIEGTEHEFPVDMVILAIGQTLPPTVLSEVKRTRRGFIEVDDLFRSSVRGVFAGGDAITGEGTVVLAVSHGKRAAHSIHTFLTASNVDK